MQKYGLLTSRGMKIFPAPRGPFFRQSGFIPVGREDGRHAFVPQAQVPWVDTFLLACQAENPGKERDWT